MIVVDLICEHEHRFEGWFARSEDVENQQQRGLLVCAICGSHEMRRLPSAPHIRRSGSTVQSHAETRMEADTQENAAATTPTASGSTSDAPVQPGEAGQLLQLLTRKLREAAAKSEDVGEDFPKEVRRIHFGDAEERPIRGLATGKEVESLLDEGISVMPIPVTKEDLH